MLSSQDLNNVIQEYISDFINKQNIPYVVKSSIPVVWFGDMEKYNHSPKKIVTVGLNPSLGEFTEPRFEMVDLKSSDSIVKLTQTLNSYFKKNPYSWFNNFEKVLHFLDSSYYENKAANTAIHIDIYSAIATDPTWGYLSENEKENIQRTDLFKKILNILNPDIILFSANQKVFDDIFYGFRLEKSAENIGNKKRIFIRKYKNGDKLLISGINYRGQPFGGMTHIELRETMQQILSDGDKCVVSAGKKENKLTSMANSDKKENKLASMAKKVMAYIMPKSEVEKTVPKAHFPPKADRADWLKDTETYISKFCKVGDYSYGGEKRKCLAVVLDILRSENRAMTPDEVRQKCFGNYDRYGIKDSKESRKTIYECLYQHSDYNKNKNAQLQYQFLTCHVDRDHSRNNRYEIRSNLKLW